MTQWFEALTTFRHLDGWRNQRILVGTGDSLDARVSTLLFDSKVRHGWPSKDQIILENHKVFIISRKTIDGRKVSLFPWSDEIDHLWRRRRAEVVILDYAARASQADLAPLAEIVFKATRTRFWPAMLLVPSLMRPSIQRALPDLSLTDVEVLAEIILAETASRPAAVTGHPKPASSEHLKTGHFG